MKKKIIHLITFVFLFFCACDRRNLQYFSYDITVFLRDLNEKPIKGRKIIAVTNFGLTEKALVITDANGKAVLNFDLKREWDTPDEEANISVVKDSISMGLESFKVWVNSPNKRTFNIKIDSFTTLKFRLQKTDTIPKDIWVNSIRELAITDIVGKYTISDNFYQWERKNVRNFDTTFTIKALKKMPFGLTTCLKLNNNTPNCTTKNIIAENFKDSIVLIRL